ncbi:MAG: hypothetical protein IPG11_08375 [Flavobacteriales bacterium]|nr:hypothetical protein [Flavobacteriales bacterium]
MGTDRSHEAVPYLRSWFTHGQAQFSSVIYHSTRKQLLIDRARLEPAEVCGRTPCQGLGGFLDQRQGRGKGHGHPEERRTLKQFKQIEQLPDEEQHTVLKFLGAYLRDFRAKQAYA